MHLNESKHRSDLHQTAVEIEIWEVHLLRDRNNLAKTLCTYSLDNGPASETADGRLIFRFTTFDWLNNIQANLTRNKIYYSELRTVDINPLQQLLKKKIYIAEDDPDILYALSTILEDAGYHVKVASSGKPILDGNFSWVDLFILDNKMPGEDGLDICRHLRAQPATKNIPVILISAHRRAGNEALRAGANDYIEKPFHVHYLLNVVSKYTKLPTTNLPTPNY